MIAHDDLAAATPAIRRELLDVNLVAPWIVTTASLPYLRASAAAGGQGGIVNITGHAGVRPKGASIPCAATKAALGHVTELLAAALGPSGRVKADLASSLIANRYLTGEVIVLDGGMNLAR